MAEDSSTNVSEVVQAFVGGAAEAIGAAFDALVPPAPPPRPGSGGPPPKPPVVAPGIYAGPDGSIIIVVSTTGTYPGGPVPVPSQTPPSTAGLPPYPNTASLPGPADPITGVSARGDPGGLPRTGGPDTGPNANVVVIFKPTAAGQQTTTPSTRPVRVDLVPQYKPWRPWLRDIPVVRHPRVQVGGWANSGWPLFYFVEPAVNAAGPVIDNEVQRRTGVRPIMGTAEGVGSVTKPVIQGIIQGVLNPVGDAINWLIDPRGQVFPPWHPSHPSNTNNRGTGAGYTPPPPPPFTSGSGFLSDPASGSYPLDPFDPFAPDPFAIPPPASAPGAGNAPGAGGGGGLGAGAAGGQIIPNP